MNNVTTFGRIPAEHREESVKLVLQELPHITDQLGIRTWAVAMYNTRILPMLLEKENGDQ